MEFLTTNGAALLFYFFAVLAVVSAVMVVTLRNPMYSAFSLLLTFLSMAALFVLRHAEFLAVVQVFVYGGGIMVLFLFVIRLREITKFAEHAPLALMLAFLLVALVGYVFLSVALGPALVSPAEFVTVEGEVVGNSQAIAWQLYREYLLPFEIASVFLLVAMIGAVVLGRET